jgi:hypothetical protein
MQTLLRRPNGSMRGTELQAPSAPPSEPAPPIVQPRSTQTAFTAFIGAQAAVTIATGGYVVFDFQTLGADGSLVVETEFPGSGHSPSGSGGPPYFVSTYILNALLPASTTGITMSGNGTVIRLNNTSAGAASCTITAP